MLPLAKLWTFVGQSFVPFAAAWIYFVRNGSNEGVLISKAYFGVLITLCVGAVLVWTLALYVRAAKLQHSSVIIPPNTTFEELGSRNLVVSWGTLIVFGLAVIVSLAAFGLRYGESRIHYWDDNKPLAGSFFESRKAAHRIGCARQPCFAVSSRSGTSEGVAEYIPYVTDGFVAFLIALCCGGNGVIVSFRH